MRPRGWHSVRQSWLRCGWIGCTDRIDAPARGLCAAHFRRDDELALKFKRAQLCFEFTYRPAVVVSLPAAPVFEYQIAFDYPRPRIRGSRAGGSITLDNRRMPPPSVVRANWNYRKERMLEKKALAHAHKENVTRQKKRWKVIEAQWEKEGA